MFRDYARALVLAFVLAAIAVRAQTPEQQTPAFAVASVKESTTIAAGGGGRLMPGGGIAMRHLSARNYVTMAFQLEPYQLVGGPAWMATTYYDVQAKPAATATRDGTFKMLQTLLRDRFHLQFHRESRQLDGYALILARAGQLGPNLRRSSLDCEKVFATTPRCREGGFNTNGTLTSVGVPLYTLVRDVVNQVQAPVVDETQLDGTFDIDLRWSPDLAKTDDAPSIFTALQEQLGLKLERKRVPTEMFFIDHVEKPTPD
jgi:uncharacterized protein (TIGR03435 family)